MNKRKVFKVTIEYEKDGHVDIFFNIEGTFSESRNSRKAAGFKNIEEWTEYHVTWCKYDQELKPVEVASTQVPQPERQSQAWCGIHHCEPGECFAQHVSPTAFAHALDYEMGIAVADSERWKEEFAKSIPMTEKEKEDVIQLGKEQTMRMYNLTDYDLDKWFEEENGDGM